MAAGVVSQLADRSKFESNAPPRRAQRKAFGVFEPSTSSSRSVPPPPPPPPEPDPWKTSPDPEP
jgi:hypothetical protein